MTALRIQKQIYTVQDYFDFDDKTVLDDPEDVLALPSIGVDILLSVIYRRVVWENEAVS